MTGVQADVWYEALRLGLMVVRRLAMRSRWLIEFNSIFGRDEMGRQTFWSLATRVMQVGVLALGVATACPAHAGCAARFSCSFGPHPACFFMVRNFGRNQFFRVGAGRSQRIYGISPGAGFCESTNGYPNTYGCRMSRVSMVCH